jgi:hydroxypyruvate isomerase
VALKFSANLSMLFGETFFLERFERAAAAGFTTVEFMFPYGEGIPEIKTRLETLNLKLALFNLPPGELEMGEWGTLSNPRRRDFFQRSFESALDAAVQLDCSLLNMMYGQREEDLSLEAQAECAMENLAWAAPKAAQDGVTLLLEPLNPSDFPRYALHSTAQALEVIQNVSHPQVGLQYDLYHAQMTEGNLINTIRANLNHIRHIQLADVPGRHEPGTGEINFPVVFAALEGLGYDGYIGLEYRPLGGSEESLEWLERSARGTGEIR